MNKGKIFCKHAWTNYRVMTDEEMTQYRRTNIYRCIKCGKEKPGGLFLPPGPINREAIARYRDENKGD